INVTVSLKKGEKNFAAVCATEKIEAEEKKEKPTLTLVPGTKTQFYQKADATIGGNAEGWELVWFTKGDAAPKVKEEKKDEGMAVQGDSEPEDDEEAGKEEEPE